MAKTYKLKPRAVEDLEGIYAYSLRGWGAERADQYIRDIFAAFQNLADNDKLGRDYKHVRPDLYAFNIVSHEIFYKVTSDGITVIRVLHKSMDSRKHF